MVATMRTRNIARDLKQAQNTRVDGYSQVFVTAEAAPPQRPKSVTVALSYYLCWNSRDTHWQQ